MVRGKKKLLPARIDVWFVSSPIGQCSTIGSECNFVVGESLHEECADVPNVQAALIACLLMGALRCIDLDSAYRSIHWKSLILIVGMLPFSIALQKTGGVELAADGLMAMTSGAGTYALLASLFAPCRPVEAVSPMA